MFLRCLSVNLLIIEQGGLFALYVTFPREWVVQNVTVVPDSSIQAAVQFFYFPKSRPSRNTTPPPRDASDRDTL